MRCSDRIEEERKLCQRVLAGDEAAWRTLYDRAFNDLWIYVSWRCAGLRHLAEEITQETWLVAVRRIGDFDPDRAGFVSWLRGIAAHQLRNALRDRLLRREQSLATIGQAELFGNDQEQQEQVELIARLLAELPERYEAVLRAKYLDLSSVEEIADEWGETAKAVESLLTRARQAFRTAHERLADNDVLFTEEEP